MHDRPCSAAYRAFDTARFIACTCAPFNLTFHRDKTSHCSAIKRHSCSYSWRIIRGAANGALLSFPILVFNLKDVLAGKCYVGNIASYIIHNYISAIVLLILFVMHRHSPI